MHISLNWLRHHINLENKEVKEVAELLTSGGLEVEGLSEYSNLKGSLSGVVVGQVNKVWQHPNADKLNLTMVDIGADEELQIVCGAPNVALGQKVAVATIGSRLTFSNGDEIKIKKGKIRGEASFGMLCAEDELGLGNGHDGIMVLDKKASVGTPLEEVVKVYKDHIIEVGLTPNRVDAASHRGMARDLSAKLKTPLESNRFDLVSTKDSGLDYSIDIQDTVGCPRYTGLKISGVNIEESPEWIQNYLRAVGLQPINNIVDITNYVMLDLGHPLHAFDFDQLAGPKIVVRKAKSGELIKTLDDQERNLDGTELLICDADKPLALAGVLGGIDSGISNNTVNILLESAYFNPSMVRKCAKKHQISTDASFRFERGVDPNDTIEAISYAAELIVEIAGGQMDSFALDVYPSPQLPVEMDFSLTYLRSITGFDIESREVEKILTGLGIAVEQKSDNNWKLIIPTFKPDVTRPIDVVEEVMRIYGYDNVPLMARMQTSIPSNTRKVHKELDRKIGELLIGERVAEIKTTPFDIQKNERQVEVLNPLSAEMTHLRSNHLESGLRPIAYNLNRQQKSARFFEIANDYGLIDGKYIEEKKLTVWLCGDQFIEDSWSRKNRKTGFYDAKGLLNKIIDGLSISDISTEPEVENGDWLYKLKYQYKGKYLAQVGQVQPQLCEKEDINGALFAIQIDYKTLLEAFSDHKIELTELGKFPRVMRDLSFVVEDSVHYQNMIEAVQGAKARNLIYTHCFDLYRGKPLEKGFTSYALRFVFEDKTKTLSDKQVEKAMLSIAGQLESIGCQIRK